MKSSIASQTIQNMAFISATPCSFSALSSRSSTFINKPYRTQWKTSSRFQLITPIHQSPFSQPFSMSAVDIKTFDVFMPALSSTMTEGRIVQWLKQPGDKIEVGEAIMVVESDKADMDVESFETGYLAKIIVDEGDSAPVGEAVGIIVPNKEDIDAVQSDVPAKSPASSNSTSDPSPQSTASAPTSAIPKPDVAEIFMPALSSTMTEGKITEWQKEEGDQVQVGETVMVVESDKADMDVESFDSGFVAHIIVDAGDSCPVGEPVAYLAKSESDIAAVKEWALSQSTGASPATTPSSNTSQPAPPTSSTPTPTTSAPPASNGAVVNEGRIVASPLAKVTAKELNIDLKYVTGTGPNGRIVERDVMKASESGNAAAPEAGSQAAPYKSSGKTVATPDAKKIAKKEKIDLSTVTGTGNFGRITTDDVLRAAGKAPVATSNKKETSTKEQVSETPATTQKSAPVEMPAGAVAMNAMQKAVVQNMNASLTVPVFRVTYKIKTAALDELYAKLKPKGVTMSALLAKAVALSLNKHPLLNAAYADNAIIYRSDVNIAMAVSLNDGGLITPTLMKADVTDIYSLSRNWKDLVKRAMEKKLKPDEYNSGTFFISNMGMFGVEQFDAILPPGAPGILAIGAAKPVVSLQKNGLVGVTKEMNVTLTGDHRHIYGVDGAKFLKTLAEILENDVTELVM